MKKELKELGLSEKEIEVYLAILKLGQANVLDIARKSAIPRATVYGILESLISGDLINSVIKGKRRYYYAEDPDKIPKNLLKKQEKIDKILPQLKAKYLSSTNRPVIRYFEGKKGFITMLDDMHASVPDKGTYHVLINAKDEHNVLGDDFHKYAQKRIDRGIWIKIITERSDFTRNWPERAKRDLRHLKFAPRGQRFSVSYHIYANKIAMFSLQEPVVGVIIENKEIADMERMQFEYMWKTLK